MVWPGEHRFFLVECFMETESYMAMQCAFTKKYKFKKFDSVQSCVTISKRVKTFRETNATTSVGMVGRR